MNHRENRPLLSDASPLQRDILKTLLYFDIFNHPLTASEIYRYLPSDSTSPDEVRSACAKPPLKEVLRQDDGFFFLNPEPPSDPLSYRKTNTRRAERYMIIALFMAGIVRRFPFVRGLYVSGELSKGVLSRRGDIDFLVVTAPGRLWICRTLLILFKKVFLLNRKRFLCLNHFVAEDFLEIRERNRYIALEIATLKPLFNQSFLTKYLRANSWILDFYPNVELRAAESPSPVRRSILQTMIEFPLRGRTGDNLDLTLMSFWKNVWAKRYRHLPEEKRSQLFQTERSLSTAYAGDFLTRILSEYTRRLSMYGLEETA